jgi:hypothetical protein
MLNKKSSTVLRIGLSFLFLANALVALTGPQEFKDLIGGSFLANLFPSISSSIFVTLILINDSLMFLILFFNFKKIMKGALIWASIYIVLVMLVIWEPIDGIEHLGFLSMSLALLWNLKQPAA